MNEGIFTDRILEVLADGEIHLSGQFVWGSNYTYLAEVTGGGTKLAAVYKPSHGERPLWDFPSGSLAAREVAAFVTSLALGWEMVPPTVLRAEAPAGPGSLQLFVETDPETHYFTLSEEEKDRRLRPVALFDLLINNADRKGGHILLGPDGRLWLIDHGVTFHHQNKLRTVVWDFAGEPIPERLLSDVERFRERLSGDSGLQAEYGRLLTSIEFEAMKSRADRVLSDRCFPEPGPGRAYPWPLV